MGLLMVIVGIGPLRVTRTTSLVGPGEPAMELLFQKAPLDSIKAAVAASGKKLDEIGWLGDTLLTVAVTEDRVDVVAWLLEDGADPNGAEGAMPPLTRAIYGELPEMVELLLQFGADPDHARQEHALTPRQQARVIRNQEIIDLIESSGS
jgi:ankyrin repeat protein